MVKKQHGNPLKFVVFISDKSLKPAVEASTKWDQLLQHKNTFEPQKTQIKQVKFLIPKVLEHINIF